jgi:hypothetical protein
LGIGDLAKQLCDLRSQVKFFGGALGLGVGEILLLRIHSCLEGIDTVLAGIGRLNEDDQAGTGDHREQNEQNNEYFGEDAQGKLLGRECPATGVGVTPKSAETLAA